MNDVTKDLLEALKRAKDSLVAFKFLPGDANRWEESDEENLAAVNSAIARAEAALPAPRQDGVWREGAVWLRSAGGEILIDMEGEMTWQPIETAPKDEFLLLCGPSGCTTTPLVFTTGIMCSDYHAGRWIDHANDDLVDWGFEPTHWMPLPQPPEV